MTQMVNLTTVIDRTVEHVRATLAGDASGHDWWHVYRVWQIARRLGRDEGADPQVVELAALLHDIADWKFHGGDESAGPRAARQWLATQDVDVTTIEEVCQIIGEISFKGSGVATPMSTLAGRVVQDADRLDALGAIGIARAFAYGGHKGRPLYDPAVHPEQHDSFAAYKNNRGPTLNHFHEKLLLLKDRMNTVAGRRLAAERHAFMEQFLEHFLSEWNLANE